MPKYPSIVFREVSCQPQTAEMYKSYTKTKVYN